MHIDIIRRFEEFEQLRDNWNHVYDADDQAQFFMSWDWLSDWLQAFPSVWMILAAKADPQDRDYVAFLPLRVRGAFDPKRGLYNTACLAGEGYSDYAGVLALPEHETAAIPALANHLKSKLNWAELKLDNLLASDRRRRMLLAPFDQSRFVQREISYFDKSSQVDNAVCLSIDLPGDWDAYLATLGASTRQKMRRLLRRLEESSEHRITLSTPETAERDIEVLLDFWTSKWGAQKKEKLSDILILNRGMLRCCARNGTLLAPIFWNGDQPVAVLGTLIDQRKKSLLFMITGRDESFTAMPSGFLLHAFSIRYAIEHGFTTYDFLHGDEAYKRMLGTNRETRLHPLTIRTRSGVNFSGELEQRCLPQMVKRANTLESNDQHADAERAYRDLAQAAPGDAEVLFRLGRLLARRMAFTEAAEVLVRCLRIKPEADNAWLWLGRARQEMGFHALALSAFRKALEIAPGNAEARKALVGASLVRSASDAAKIDSHPPIMLDTSVLRSMNAGAP